MRIAILGTRGIPNCYGGFEQFAEYAAPLLAARGHEVFVYNSSLHPFKGHEWNNVHLLKKWDPEGRWGTIGQFIYDFNCIRDSRKRMFDIILQLGYTSSSVWSFLLPKHSIVVTNMDGFEWQRKKYSKPVQNFLKQAERWAVQYSDYLVADSTIIQSYLRNKYRKDACYIPYGAYVFDKADDDQVLRSFHLEKNRYNLVISRMEKENHIETIIEGCLHRVNEFPLVIIGNYTSPYGRYLKKKYDGQVTFLGPLFDAAILNQLRYFSNLYFHGHSVGGTNPSLLEAMASQALIAAHDNPFNHHVLGNNAFYFSNSGDIKHLLNVGVDRADHQSKIAGNKATIAQCYSWDSVIDKLENYFIQAIKNCSKHTPHGVPTLAQEKK